jgi:hypothetical protein
MGSVRKRRRRWARGLCIDGRIMMRLLVTEKKGV